MLIFLIAIVFAETKEISEDDCNSPVRDFQMFEEETKDLSWWLEGPSSISFETKSPFSIFLSVDGSPPTKIRWKQTKVIGAWSFKLDSFVKHAWFSKATPSANIKFWEGEGDPDPLSCAQALGTSINPQAQCNYLNNSEFVYVDRDKEYDSKGISMSLFDLISLSDVPSHWKISFVES